MNTEFTVTQKRALAIITLLALVLGAYFLRHYFILVVIAAIVAYLFTPLYNRCRGRFGSGLSATFTVLAALATVIIPVGALLTLAVLQISHMLVHVADWVETADMSTVGNQALTYVNQALGRLPFGHFSITTDSLRDTMISVSQNLGRWLLHALQGAAGGVIGVVTSAIIFLYVLISLLTNQEQLLLLIRRLNPLGEEVTDLYLAKMGAMVKGTVKGQFIIALVQGLLGAASIYIAGFHQGFFIFAIFLTALSVIPLGSGIVTIPFGIGMMFFGNVGGGLFVVLFHLIGVTNVDNFLRPILVPREARLDPALMLLAVFSGIAMFGFWGIVLGPVLMIIIVTTISVYLAVYKGVEMTSHEPPEKRRRIFRRRLRAETEATAAAADGERAED
ncbi:AI-2E family transporter [Mycolicibacterium sphagni]|uniref:AI-2E family transporter n=1 Tax=Mycolicibacterium sphagni TaxID=1786 RepID=A0ABX2JP11_9MYCO|nr:AI-2E family transporter [Mycolicibacterium sphagni]